MKRILSIILILILVSSTISGCADSTTTTPKAENVKLDLGNIVSETEGNTDVAELKFANEKKMLKSMQLACENEKFELYYSQDNMSIALKDKQSGKIMLSNPHNAALDQNYSGNVANRLNSQVIVTYLQEENTLIDMYSSVDCADLGQYKIKTYDNGLVMELSIGEEKESSIVPKVLPVERYEEIYNALLDDSKDLLEIYYTRYANEELDATGIYDLYPDMKVESDVYYCDFDLGERDIRKLSSVFEEANYTREKKAEDEEKLNLGKSTDSFPNFKMSLNYCLTNNGVKVTIPNESICYNKDFPLLKITLLPYFGSDEAKTDATGYLFIPDGTGAIINMNQNEPNRRTIITGKVYGENASALPKEKAIEKTEQYYLPVFGTVRNNNTALFGIITNGDANSQITALLGRPNGNYYTTYPEFIIADYEKYTRVSVVNNLHSNKEIYLYDKNITTDDLSVEYSFLKDEKANYSAMAEIYRNYLYGDKKEVVSKPVLNLETIGSVLAEESFLGIGYLAETTLTSFEDNIEILKYLQKNNAKSLSLQLNGWQEDGLDTKISNEMRVSSVLGGESGLNNLIKYCNDSRVKLSLNNNFSFVRFDKSFDDFSADSDATRTLELQYAFNTEIDPSTMLSSAEAYVVKASSYNRYLSNLVSSSKEFSLDTLNLGELGSSLNSDYTKENGINRGEALRYVKQALNSNSKASFSFKGGNAYVLPYAKMISDISNENSGFIGESAVVPFLQIVIGDKAAYNSKPINLKENVRYELLNCIESGTVPTFLLSYDNTSALKGTQYTQFYAVDYKILKKEILDSYSYVEKVISASDGSAVTEHNVLENGVAVVTFANGAKVYVNKSQKDYFADGITVKAMDYAIKG